MRDRKSTIEENGRFEIISFTRSVEMRAMPRRPYRMVFVSTTGVNVKDEELMLGGATVIPKFLNLPIAVAILP